GIRLLEPCFLTVALALQLIPVEPRDDLGLLHGIAFVYGALDQLARDFESDIDLRQLHVARDANAVVGLAAAPERERAGDPQGHDHDNPNQLLRHNNPPPIAGSASAFRWPGPDRCAPVRGGRAPSSGCRVRGRAASARRLLRGSWRRLHPHGGAPEPARSLI